MSDLILSQGQREAFDMVGRFLKDEEQRIAIITGYAGTGKTTTLKMLAKTFGTPTVLAPTGKAALRVTEATGLRASTVHRFLYTAETDPKTGAPVFVLRDVYDMAGYRGSLIVVDESSMVGKDLWADLNAMSRVAGFKLLLMGDTFQLPPVTKSGEEPFNVLDWDTPYKAHLTEIHRQALDSPILRASMLLREGRPEFEAMKLLTPIGASKVIDQIIDSRTRGGAAICHTNARRHSVNNRVRETLGYISKTLHDGEPLLVTQNNYSLDRYNGEVIDFLSWDHQPEWNQIVSDRYTTSSLEMNFGIGNIDAGGGHRDSAMLSPDEICGRTDGSNVGNWAIRKFSRYAYENIGDRDEAPPYLHCNYGYALTVHKSQGSEWPEVLLVLDDSMDRMPAMLRRRWLYTAVTRGKTTLRYAYLRD